MSVNINVNQGDIPSAQISPAKVVIQLASQQGSPFAQRAAGITVPVLRVNQTGLEYEQRRDRGQLQFRFSKGVLQLSLRQSVFLANTLSTCAQKIWEAHEMEHVRDNQELMKRMEREIKASRTLQDIFNNPTWRPRKSFGAVQRTIQSTVGEIFQRLTREAVQKRDTQSGYEAIWRQIKEKCENH